MIKQIDKAANCKKLIGSTCALDKLTGFVCGWDNCEPGYDFYLGENRYQKCRYHCFKHNVDTWSIPFLLELIECESSERKVGEYNAEFH
jgi:hypothetical protein